MKLGIPGVPFTHNGSKSVKSASNNSRRADIIKKFVGMTRHEIMNLRTIDIGSENMIGRLVGTRRNTVGDLNTRCIGFEDGTYDFVLNSEIIEHIMNPLGVMQDIYRMLKPGGICVVATPIQPRIGAWYDLDKHFVEYRPWRLKQLFLYCGFEVIKYRRYSIWKWFPFAFTGIRPLMRCLFHRSQMWLIRKPY